MICPQVHFHLGGPSARQTKRRFPRWNLTAHGKWRAGPCAMLSQRSQLCAYAKLLLVTKRAPSDLLENIWTRTLRKILEERKNHQMYEIVLNSDTGGLRDLGWSRSRPNAALENKIHLQAARGWDIGLGHVTRQLQEWRRLHAHLHPASTTDVDKLCHEKERELEALLSLREILFPFPLLVLQCASFCPEDQFEGFWNAFLERYLDVIF